MNTNLENTRTHDFVFDNILCGPHPVGCRRQVWFCTFFEYIFWGMCSRLVLGTPISKTTSWELLPFPRSPGTTTLRKDSAGGQAPPRPPGWILGPCTLGHASPAPRLPVHPQSPEPSHACPCPISNKSKFVSCFTCCGGVGVWKIREKSYESNVPISK